MTDSPRATAHIMLPERVPWLGDGLPAFVIDINPSAPRVLEVKARHIDARAILTTSTRWPRFLQARQTPVPWTGQNPAPHYGYSHFTELGVYLVGPDNPHVAALATAKRRKEVWNELQRNWTTLYSSRNLPEEFNAAAAAMAETLNSYLKAPIL